MTSQILSLSTVLYGFCSVLLAGAALFLIVRDGQSPQVRWFVATSLALLVWVVTLFLFNHSTDPGYVLQIGRANFAAVSLAVYFGYRFVRAVAGSPKTMAGGALGWLSVCMALIAALTPWIDQAEHISQDATASHQTMYGPLFAVYVLHIVGTLASTLWVAFRESRAQSRAHADRHRRDQLLLIGGGILATGTVSLVTNALLPFALGNFRWIDIGPLSTLLFLLAVAYATVRHRLFDIRIFLRRTLVLGIALSLVLACYSALVLVVTDRFAGSGSSGLTRLGVLIIVCSFDPLRRALEKRIDRLLFPRELSGKRVAGHTNRQHRTGEATAASRPMT